MAIDLPNGGDAILPRADRDKTEDSELLLQFLESLNRSITTEVRKQFDNVKTVADAAITSTADGSTIIDSGGSLFLATGGVDTVHLADGSVTTAKIENQAVITTKLADVAVTTTKIANSAVTTGKIENLGSYTVLGNVTATTGESAHVTIYDEDNLSSDSDTGLVTQQSVKAYVDTAVSTLSTRCVLAGGASISTAQSETFVVFGGPASSAAVGGAYSLIPYSGTLQNMFVWRRDSGGSATMSIFINETTSALSVALGAGTASGSDSSTVVVSSGDHINWRVNPGSLDNNNHSIMVEFVG